ncbi:MAG: VWA domain-containing protein [Bacteroidales bacterium]|nr:VWA domain-containing protein [Bacteroidales bacterium]
MNNNTELIFIIDQSGSMSGLESDTIGGFNSMLQKHQQQEGTCHISTIFFSNKSEVIHNRKNINEVKPLTSKDYIPGGSTALLDAIGNAINHTIKVQRLAAEDEKAKNVVFVIITDGEENSSREYSSDQIHKMISLEQEEYGWEFMFLGANIDAIKTAKTYGIHESRASNFVCDSSGVQLNFSAIGNAILGMRKSGKINDNWCEEIEQDFQKRNSK